MKKYLIVTFLLILGSVSFAQEDLTLEKAISIALQRNSNLIISKNNIASNQANVKTAYGALLPSLRAGAGWDWSKNQYDGNITDSGIDETADSRAYKINAGGSIVLFDGLSNYANISKREGELKAANYDLMKLKQDVVFETTSFYYEVLRYAELVKVREENVIYNQKQLETIQEKNRLGSVPVADVYTQQVQLGNAKVTLITEKNNYENAISDLLNYLAVDVFQDYSFTNPFANTDSLEAQQYVNKFGDMSELVETAFKKRLDYKSQMQKVANQEDNLSMAKGKHFGTLSGTYNYGARSGKIGNVFDTQTWSAGLSLDIPIFSNFNISSSVDIAEVGVKNEMESKNQLERLIQIQIKQGYLNLKQAKEALDVSYQNVRSAEENRRINNERYNLGSGTILEVLQSTRDYQNALSAKINAEFVLYKSSDRLLNYIGQLDYKLYEESSSSK